MKRYYLSEIYNAGPLEGWRHRMQDYVNTPYRGGEIAVDPQTGIPTQKALLVLVEDRDHVRFRGKAGLIPLPDVALDIKVSAIDTKTKGDTVDKAKAIGFADAELAEVFDNAKSHRDVLNHFGRKNNPNFDADAFEV